MPGDLRPEFLVLYLQYRTVPPWLFQAPVPVIALAGDANLQWHAYRQLAGCCDAILTDCAAVERFARAGITHARPAILFGGERAMLEGAWPEVARDIDLLFVGNFQADVQRERLPLLGRLAQLRPRWNVVLATNVYGEEYRKLLARSRIVFNRGIRGEWNARVCEALAAGALLFQDAGNREVFDFLEDRKECVAYTPDNLIPLLQHFLESEDERRAIAEAGRARVQELSFGRFWQDALDAIDQDWEALAERAAGRIRGARAVSLTGRGWQVYPATAACDASLVPDLRAAVAAEPRRADLCCALGWVESVARFDRWPQAAAAALPLYQRAWASDPSDIVAGLNVAETLLDLGRTAEGAQQARQTLAALDAAVGQQPGCSEAAGLLDAGHYRPEFDDFRVGWEQAAWEHVGDPALEAQAKRQILRWRLHLILGDMTGELPHFEAAASAQPDQLVSSMALGCALARLGRIAEAVPHLQRAVDANPFDRDAARALFQALEMVAKPPEREAFIEARRQLALAAPQLIPPEPWFQGVGGRIGNPSYGVSGQPAGVRQFPQLSVAEFHRAFGDADTSRAICAFTVQRDPMWC